MNPRRKKRLLITSLLVTGLAVSIALVLYALQQNIDLFYTPSEIIKGKNETGVKPEIGQRLRIGGMVVPNTVKRDPSNLKVSFDLIDNGGESVTVFFNGILPDLFREGQGIVAQGELINATQINAFEVLAKHDEEYMPPEVSDALKGLDHLKINSNK
ncbi:cytochrome c maturation protein CcmE [Psychromonas antarctica]|jgi:cytochrome c-type biogenesis protein CcmE|uniref:cytochrome c maturation protein CcmE n=1 Tax=Psychromonas antarctica TaxID=67573 RepID=UPI001EE93F7E|nr:cytochrome c maturation protein CcmE [Psychromonas antarctica]MCG6199813.1 cytochrome c maturation protein CcmE [Psychromonas antarctica]